MTFSRKFLLAVWLLGTLCFLGADPAAARKPKPKFAIKFATLAPEGSAWMQAMHEIDDEVRARTENRLGFKFYPGGVQGDEKDVLRKIRMGQLHGGGFTGFGIGAIASDVRVLEMPFMFRDHAELDFVRDALAIELNGMLAHKGYLNLGWVDVGFTYIFSKNPIANLDDLSKARMWIWAGDPLAEVFFQAFGISPIPLAAPDVLTSLQTGVIDAAYNSPLGCLALQWFTRVDYMTEVPISHGLGTVLINEKALRKVSAEDRAVLQEVAGPILRDLTEKTRTQNREAIAEMRKEGVQVVPVDDAVKARFFATGRDAWGNGVDQLYSAELLRKVQDLLDRYRAGNP